MLEQEFACLQIGLSGVNTMELKYYIIPYVTIWSLLVRYHPGLAIPQG
jgi:hypothetical protein